MRSRADVRRALEWLLRAALVAALALALWRSLQPVSASATSLDADVRHLRASLATATRAPSVQALSVELDSLPGRAERDWLAALRHVGVAVRWRGTPPAMAVQAERSSEPESRARVALVADSGTSIALADSAGPVDSMHTRGAGASLEAAALVGPVRAVRGRWVAATPLPDPAAPRAVLVLGRAGWESRFVMLALQEAGWTVRGRQPAAPGVAVADAGLWPLDTARYAAVVALDSTAADQGASIARFVGQGGGVVLAGDAAALPALAALSAARVGPRAPGRLLLDADTVTREDLPRRPLGALRVDAVRLEATREGPVVAARRAGLGRVVTIGYDETWRWRMLGGDGGAAAHRAWWSRTVGLVSPTPATPVAGAGDAAPAAAIVAALGPAQPAAAASAPQGAGDPLPPALLALVVALLLAEIASRRFRGAS